MNKYIAVAAGIVVVAIIGLTTYFRPLAPATMNDTHDGTPRTATLSGTYTCLPHLNTSGPQTMECAFGLKTDQGDYYAVNFGASGDAMSQFMSGEHIRAEGFIVIKEALSSDQWQKYNMKGIFTITKMLEPAAPSPTSGAKLNINVVCEGALAYMTFPDAASADKFVAECKVGAHPEVIEQYKADHNLNDATI
jgi:hypothetical protein